MWGIGFNPQHHNKIKINYPKEVIRMSQLYVYLLISRRGLLVITLFTEIYGFLALL
jgi:hypothetical protein